jgi:hypothetical protein
MKMNNKDSIEKDLEQLGQTIGSEESFVDKVMNSIDNKKIVRRTKKRVFFAGAARLAAAIVLLIVLGSITFWPSDNSESGKWWLGPSAAWGQEIREVLDTIKGVSCREQITLIESDGSKHTSSTWDIFYVSSDSYRRDIYDGDFLREIQWYVPGGNGTLHHSICFDLKSYFTHSGEGSFGNRDPIERMRFYVNILEKTKNKRLLGEIVIEDHNCIGFEISASEYGNNPEEWLDRIWFDIEMKLPVLIEKERGRSRDETNKNFHPFINVQDQFEYNPELPNDTFIPFVPEGFVHGHPDEIEQMMR